MGILDEPAPRFTPKTRYVPQDNTFALNELGQRKKVTDDDVPDCDSILDDDSDMLEEQMPNFFRTSWQEGITEEIAKRVTEHLA